VVSILSSMYNSSRIVERLVGIEKGRYMMDIWLFVSYIWVMDLEYSSAFQQSIAIEYSLGRPIA
jgi:hypothetical protein